MSWNDKTIRIPIGKPGWFIACKTPEGYKLLSAAYTKEEHARLMYEVHKNDWRPADHSWEEPELFKVEAKITRLRDGKEEV